MATINMQTMRYINLLKSITRVNANKCFTYNNIIFFAVPSRLLSRAIGPAGKNIKIIGEKLGKKIRIIGDNEDNLKSIENFIESIVSPVEFVSLEYRDDSFILTAGSRTKAATLIGRNKKRLDELKKIIEDYFRKDIKIV
jgi:NusA-like KH domain protein